MLQRTEPAETLPTDALTIVATTTDAERIEKALPAQDLDRELAELTACIDAGVTRSKKHFATFQKTTMKRTLLFAVPTLIVLLACYLALLQGLLKFQIAIGVDIASPFVMAIASVFIVRWSRRAYPTPAKQVLLAAQRLTEIDDVRAAAPLLDALRWSSDKTVAPQIWQALGRLLPRLTAEQAHELGPERHSMLASWLQTWDMRINHSHFAKIGNRPALGMLHVLGQVGQRSYLIIQPPMKIRVSLLSLSGKWAKGQKLGRDPEIQQAAADCYEALKNQTALAYSSAQLLRASDTTSSSPEILLRPAQGVQQTDPQELLRATSTDKHDDTNV